MAKSFKTLYPNDQNLPALLVKFTLLSGHSTVGTDVLTQVDGILTNKVLSLLKLSSQSRPLTNNKQKEMKVKAKQFSFRNQEKLVDFMNAEITA
jgi:hypothetical protein